MKKNLLFVLALIAAVFAGYVYFSSQVQNQAAQEAADTPAIPLSELIRDYSPTLGPQTAKVQVVEFLDPECEACRALDPIVKGLLKEYEGKIFFAVRYMPFHQNSNLAAASLEEAREQGKYWEALSTLFYYQHEWGNHNDPQPALIQKYLSQLGIKASTLEKNKVLEKHKWKVDQDFADGKKLGVNATPTFFVNGRKLEAIGYEPIKQAIEKELANSK